MEAFWTTLKAQLYTVKVKVLLGWFVVNTFLLEKCTPHTVIPQYYHMIKTHGSEARGQKTTKRTPQIKRVRLLP